MEIDFVDLFQDHDDSSLDELIFHAGDAQWPRLSILFRNVLTQTGLRTIASTMKSLKKILQVVPQVHFIVFKRDTIDARCLASFQSAERKPEQLIIEQREQVIENRVRLRDRSMMDLIQPPTSTLKKTVHRCSVSEYGRCAVWIMYWPDRLPCTDITRLRSIRLVAGLQRYYTAIRLPERHLPSLLIRLVGHTRSVMTGVS